MSSSFVAGGNITPSRFVMQSITNDRVVIQATSSASGATQYATVIGISQVGTHLTPLLNLDDGYAAVLGENVGVYTKDDEEAWLELGGTVAAGDLLKSGTDGRGLTTTADGDFYGAKALVAGTVGQVVKVQPTFGFRGS